MIALFLGALLTLAVFGLVVLLAAVWAHRLWRGSVFHPVASAFMVFGYLLLFFLVETGSWLNVDGAAPVDLALLASAVVLGGAYTFRSARTFRTRQGQLGYRSRIAIPVTWVVLFFVQIYTQVIVFGQVSFLGYVVLQGIPSPVSPIGSSIPGSSALVLAVVDGLFALSTGINIGHIAGVYARFASRIGRPRPSPG